MQLPMPRPISRRNLPLLLLQAREAVIAHFRPILQHFDLTEQQWRVLRTLAEEGAREPWQISERCQILKPSLSGVLTRMEELGLVQRSRVESDQRRLMIAITRQGAALVQRMAPLVEAQYAQLEQALGKDQVAALYETLDRLLASPHGQVRTVKLGQPERRSRARTAAPSASR